MAKIVLDTIVQQSDEQVSSEIDGEAVLMHIDTGDYFKIDEVGSRVWALMEEAISVSSLCDKLMEEFEVPLEQCHQDVIALLENLQEEALITVG